MSRAVRGGAAAEVVLFDLDGVLADSHKAITSCMNAALAAAGVEPWPEAELHRFIGPSLSSGFAEILGVDAADPAVAAAIHDYRARYAQVFVRETPAYPGVVEAVQAVGGERRIGVATSKPRAFSEPLLDAFGLSERLEVVAAPELDTHVESKSQTVAAALAALGDVPGGAMVGDRDVDMRAAHDHGLRAVGVLWGFGAEAELREAGADVLVVRRASSPPPCSAADSVRGSCEHTFVPRTDATILHADLDAFYASVEQRDDPSLRGRPVIVGAGVVLAASYEAKALGIKTAMGGGLARRLCPQAAVVSPRFEAYSEASKAVFAIFEDTTPQVEGLSIDEAFLDVRGMERIAGKPRAIAERLRARVKDQVGLAVTVGIARTKFLAKVASAQAKPDGLLEVPPDGELAFLHPLPVEALWGVGRKTAEKLHARGITTVAQVAALAETTLVEMLGRGSGRQLHALSHNRDPRRVTTGVRRRSIGSQSAIGRRKRTRAELDAYLVAIVDRISRRLRAARRVCRTVTLRLRFDDYATRATRSHTVAEPTQRTDVLLTIARGLLAAAMPAIERHGITLLGVSLGNLENQDAVQLVLPLDRRPSPALDTAVDDVRERFGKEAITRAVLIGRDRGWQPPMLPD